MSVASRSALCSTRHFTMSTKPLADAVSSGLSPSRFFASTWQPAWQSARATAEYPCHAAQCSGVSCSWKWKCEGIKPGSSGRSRGCMWMRMCACSHPVRQVWVGPDAAQVAHHIHVAVASRHVKCGLPRLEDTTKN